MKHVCVVLPTYNGAKHVVKQLESLLHQTYPSIDVIMRDDGSTDETVSLIEHFMKNVSGSSSISFSLMHDDLGNLGCPNSFYQIIITHPAYDIYAFCDQDDIWHPNKIERAVKALERCDNQSPAVYFSSFMYCSEDGLPIRVAPEQPHNIPPSLTYFYTPGLGFTIAFNKAACHQFILDVDTGSEMHDRWMLRCAACFGSIIYDPEPTADHIRHDEAVTAADRRILDLARGFIRNELYGDRAQREARCLNHFKRTFSHKLGNQVRSELDLFTARDSVATRLKKLAYPHRLRTTMLGELAVRALFLLGKS